MRIVVTGAGGFIGRALTKKLADEENEVIAVDNNYRGALNSVEQSKNISLEEVDVLDAEAVDRVIDGADAVYHLAYINGTQNFYDYPEKVLEIGVIGTHNVLKSSIKSNIKFFCLASSSEVYQRALEIPTPEEVNMVVPDIMNPRYSYGGGKIACELLTVNYLRKTSIPYMIFRPHNIYGPKMGFEHVIPQIIKKILIAKNNSSSDEVEIEIQGTGKETRAFMYVDDAVDSIKLCSNTNEKSAIYHIGNSEEITITQLIEAIAKIMGVNNLKIKSAILQEGSTDRRCPDTTKLDSLGYNAKFSLEDGLKEAVDWYTDFYINEGVTNG